MMSFPKVLECVHKLMNGKRTAVVDIRDEALMPFISELGKARNRLTLLHQYNLVVEFPMVGSTELRIYTFGRP